ncbi:MAG: T9SS type A sorting domain-containing protein [Bacteroidia bacterium]
MKKITLLLLLFYSALSIAQVPTTWNSRGVGGGGALFSPSINPGNDNEYYLACDMSELFHFTDFGLTYKQVKYSQLQASIYSRVAFTNSNIQYSINNSTEVGFPVKSTNGGVNWTALTGNPNPSEEAYGIYADYLNSNNIVLNYYGSVYFSNNGGTSFSLIHNALSSGVGLVVGGVFFDGGNIYVGTNDGVFVSINNGVSFSLAALTGIPATERIFSFAAAKQGGATRLFCLTADVNDVYAVVPGYDYWGFVKGIYSCDYGVSNWTPKMTGININSDFLMYVSMASNDINKVYLAGSNSNGEPNIMKTTNGGANWTHVFNTTLNQNIITGWSGASGDRTWGYGECALGVAVAPNNADKVIFTDFGFAHVTSDGGANWRQAYVASADQNPAGVNTPKGKAYTSNGLENTTCWQISWIDSLNMFSCFSDIKGVRSTDGGKKWSFNYTGNDANSMYRLVKNPSNGYLYAGTSGIHDMYQSTRLQDATLDANDSYGKIIYSTNSGASWSQLHYFGHPVFWLALDPNNSNRAYASVIHYGGGTGVGGIYKCDDLQTLSSSTWTKLSNPPRTEGHPASIVVLNDGKVVCTYSGRRTSVGTFTNSSGCFIYDPVANSWTDVSHPGMYYWTKDVVVDPSDPSQNTWFVCVFSGWGGAPNGLGGLYRTTNRGASWTKISSSDRVTSITFNPLNNDMIYMTTERLGLRYSLNIHAATPTFSPAGSYPFRQPERVFFNPYKPTEVWVSSFGNGMRVGDICNNITSTIAASGPVTFCKPGNVTLNANTGTGLSYQWLRNNVSISGATTSTYTTSLSGTYKCTVTTSLGCSKNSNGIKVTATNCRLSETKNGEDIAVYPNPVNDILNINSETDFSQIIITDVFGKEVLKSNETAIDVSDLSNGIYFISIFNSENLLVGNSKFIKQ